MDIKMHCRGIYYEAQVSCGRCIMTGLFLFLVLGSVGLLDRLPQTLNTSLAANVQSASGLFQVS